MAVDLSLLGEPEVNTVKSCCPICHKELFFSSANDFWTCRDSLSSKECPLNGCLVRERAVAEALFSLFDREKVKKMSIHEAAPTPRGLSLWLRQNAIDYVFSGFFPDKPWGSIFNGFRNENLESQTFQDESFDLVIHLDVLEHLFNPFQALREIYRTLKPLGVCLFSVPTEHNRFSSEQVATLSNTGNVVIIGEPEYHGNPQRSGEGSLVTWRYGYDLPLLISRNTCFDVEVRRWQSRTRAIMGHMTEIYILTKR